MANKISNQELFNAINNLQEEIRKMKLGFEVKIDELEFRMQDRMKEESSKIHMRFDDWARELDAVREDRVLTTKQLKDHEKCIKKLEKVQN